VVRLRCRCSPPSPAVEAPPLRPVDQRHLAGAVEPAPDPAWRRVLPGGAVENGEATGTPSRRCPPARRLGTNRVGETRYCRLPGRHSRIEHAAQRRHFGRARTLSRHLADLAADDWRRTAEVGLREWPKFRRRTRAGVRRVEKTRRARPRDRACPRLGMIFENQALVAREGRPSVAGLQPCASTATKTCPSSNAGGSS